MRFVFWSSLAFVAYAYVGYAVWLSIVARFRSCPFLVAPIEPSVSVLMAVHNEQGNLPRKLAGLLSLDYPASRLQIVVASDGSTDSTNDILRQHADRVASVYLPQPGGKAAALNHAVAASSGEILVFMDARQSVDPKAIRELVSCFADSGVGAVSGELLLETEGGELSADSLGIYWRIEKVVRKLESRTGSVVGVTGALFAMRRELYVPLPPGTLLDDVLTPMQVARAGKRVLFLETAIARDRIFVQPGKEFARKVRTLTGNYQLLRLAPWLLSMENPLLFRLISHKLLRLVVPLLLALMLVSSGAVPSPFFNAVFVLQLLVYVLALLGALWPATRRFRLVSLAYTFAMLNAAAVIAFYNLLAGRARWA